MKSVFKLLTFFVAFLLLAVGCSSDDTGVSGSDDAFVSTDSGYLSFDGLSLVVSVDVETFLAEESGSATKADDSAEVDLSDFIVKITKDDDQAEVVYLDTYANTKDLIDPLTLSVGTYNLEVMSCETEDIALADWDCPEYMGSTQFIIGSGIITEISSVTCYLSNVMVSVSFSTNLMNYFDTDAEGTGYELRAIVEVTNDAATDESDAVGSLSFYAANATENGYFRAPSDETMTIYLVGRYNLSGEGEEPNYLNVEKGDWVQTITGVKAGQYRNITFKKDLDDSLYGSVEVDLEITTWVYSEDIDVDITGSDFVSGSLSEDVIDEDGSTGGDGSGGTDTEEDEDATVPSVGNVPTIVWNGDYDFDTRYEISSDTLSNPKIDLIITSEHPDGLTSLWLNIDSETLSAEMLEFAYLYEEIDLVNAEDKDRADHLAMLEALGLPYGDAIKGKSEITLSITADLIQLLVYQGAGASNFTVIAGDANGESTETVMLYCNESF